MTDSIRILHVDDQPDFAEMTATFLERENNQFTVETATSPTDGLEKLKSENFDCVISDYEMPDTNGIEFLRTVRDSIGDLPFILFTGKGSEEIASEAISAGVTDYIQKDAGTDQYTLLSHRISNAVTAHQSATEAERRRYRLEQILKTVPGCVVQLNQDGEFVFANDRAEEVLGLERQAVTDRSYNDPEWNIKDLNGEPIPDEELPFRLVRDTGEPIDGFRHTIQWPDGSKKVLLVSGAPLFNEDGEVETVVFSLTDITDQYEQRQDLRAIERRLELALEATDTGIWEWNLETDEVRWNETLQRTLGLEPGEFEGTFEAFINRVHPADQAAIKEQIDRALSTDSMYQAEFRMLKSNDDVQWVAVRGQLIEDNGTSRMIGIHQNISDRKERKQALKRERDRFETLLTTLPEPVALLSVKEGPEPIIKTVNPAFEDVFQFDQSELTGNSINEFIVPAEYSDEASRIDQAALDETVSQTEVQRQTATGEIRDFLLVTSAIGGSEETETAEGLAIYIDITDRKQRQRELIQERDRFQALFEQLPEPIVHGYIEDNEPIVEAVNPAFENIFGYDEQTVVGEPVDEYIVPPDYQQGAKELNERARNQGDIDDVSVQRQTTDGVREFLFRNAQVPGTDDNEGFAIYTDVTDQKRLEREKQEGLQAFQQLYAISSDRELDFESKVESILELGCEYLDLTNGFLTRIENDIQHIETANSTHPDLQSGAQCPLAEAYCKRTIKRDQLLTIVNASAEGFEEDPAYGRFGLDTYIGGRVMIDDELYGTLCFADTAVRDDGFTEIERTFVELLTRWVSYEIERQQSEQQLQQERDRLDELVSVISHDLRNPLNNAVGRVELLQMDIENEHLGSIRRSLDRMSELIDDILELANKGMRIEEQTTVSLADVVTASWGATDTRDAEIRSNIDSTRIIADESRLKQLFENLFRNAVEHGGNDIVVTVGMLDGREGFYIADDGPGIPIEEREAVFETGYSTSDSGTGFGLSIVKWIVEAHDWKIDITDSTDAGTRFEISGVNIESK